MKINIIPQPRHISMGNGWFAQNENVLKCATNSRDSQLLAGLLGINRRIKPARVENPDFLYFQGAAGEDWDWPKPTDSLGLEGYILKVDENGFVITANDEAGLLYGVQSLRQIFWKEKNIIKLPKCVITDFPAMKTRGISDDISRGQVSKLSDFKAIIDKLSFLKFNVYCPYIEDIIQFRTHPEIGRGRGRLTRREVKAIVAYGERRHIAVIPVFESLGHFENTLKLKPYRGLAEIANCLRADMPESRRLLEDLYGEMLEMFPARHFHVGCDETWEVGKGKRTGNAPVPCELFTSHLNYLHAFLKNNHRQMLVYADMFKPVFGSGHFDSSNLNKIPKDVVMVNWDYTPEADPSYARLLKDMGFKQILSPGACCGLTIFPGRKSRFANIRSMASTGMEVGCEGMISSSWCDGGGFNFRENNWLGHAYAAECAWSGICESDDAGFTGRFIKSFYGVDTDEAGDACEGAAELQEIFHNNYALLFEKPAIKYHSQQNLDKAGRLLADVAKSLRCIKQLKSLARQNEDSADFLLFSTHCAEYICNRIQWTDKSSGTPPLTACKKLKAKLQLLKSEFNELWPKKYKVNGLRNNLEKFDETLQAYSSMIACYKAGQEPERSIVEAGFIDDWHIIGPFPNPQCAEGRRGLYTDFPPEHEISLTGSSTGKDGASLQWTRASVQDDGFLDFYSEYPHCYAVAYAYTEIESPESGPATILFGSDDGARIWVNDNLVFDKLITRSAVKDEEKIPLLLEKGLNRILVKVEQNVGGWGFFLRLTGMVHAENTK